jgi:hypothetical protein
MGSVFGVKTGQWAMSDEGISWLWREVDRALTFEYACLWDHLVPLRGDVRDPTPEAWPSRPWLLSTD